jgi:CHAT domain-containing protein
LKYSKNAIREWEATDLDAMFVYMQEKITHYNNPMSAARQCGIGSGMEYQEPTLHVLNHPLLTNAVENITDYFHQTSNNDHGAVAILVGQPSSGKRIAAQEYRRRHQSQYQCVLDLHGSSEIDWKISIRIMCQQLCINASRLRCSEIMQKMVQELKRVSPLLVVCVDLNWSSVVNMTALINALSDCKICTHTVITSRIPIAKEKFAAGLSIKEIHFLHEIGNADFGLYNGISPSTGFTVACLATACADRGWSNLLQEATDLKSVIPSILDWLSPVSRNLMYILAVVGNHQVPKEVLTLVIDKVRDVDWSEINMEQSLEELRSLRLLEVNNTVKTVFVSQLFRDIILNELKMKDMPHFRNILQSLSAVLSQKLPLNKVFTVTSKDLMLIPHVVAVTKHCTADSNYTIEYSEDLLQCVRFCRELYHSYEMFADAKRLSVLLETRQGLLCNKFALAREEIRVKLADVHQLLFSDNVVTYRQAVEVCYTISSVYSKHNLTEFANAVNGTFQAITLKLTDINEYNTALVKLIDVQLRNKDSENALRSLDNACKCTVPLGRGGYKQCCSRAPRAGDINVVVYENCKLRMWHFLSHVHCNIDYCIEVGKMCHRAGLFPYAEAFLRQVIDLPHCINEMKLMVLENIAVILREANKLVEAGKAYEKLSSEAEQTENCEVQIRAYLGEAEIAVKTANLQKAQQAFQCAYDCSILNKNKTKLNPETSGEVYLRFGDWYKLQDDAKGARIWYEKMVQACSKSNKYCLVAGAYLRKAEVDLIVNDIEEAKHSLNNALALGRDEIFIQMSGLHLSGQLSKQCERDANDSYKMAMEYSSTLINSEEYQLDADTTVTHTGVLVGRGTSIERQVRKSIAYYIQASCHGNLNPHQEAVKWYKTALCQLHYSVSLLKPRNAILQQTLQQYIIECQKALNSWSETLLSSAFGTDPTSWKALEATEQGRAWRQYDLVKDHCNNLDVTIADIKKIAKDQRCSVISYKFWQQSIYMWTINPETDTVHGQWSSAGVIDTIDTIMRKAADVRWRGNYCLPDWDKSLQEIWNALIEPLRQWLPRKGSHIAIIYDEKIAAIPWGALKAQDGLYFHEKYSHSLVPSIVCLASANEILSSRYIVVAPDTSSEGHIGYLSDAVCEGKVVASMWGVPPVHDSAEAVEVLSSRKPPLNLIHVASHGTEIGLQFLAANSENPPQVSTREIEDAELKACCVFVNGCSSAGSSNKDTNNLGLIESYYKAGAEVVVGHLWPVHDATARRFILILYSFLESGYTISESVRLAILRFRAITSITDHPIFWGSLTTLGNGNKVINFPQKELTVCLPVSNYFAETKPYDTYDNSENILHRLETAFSSNANYQIIYGEEGSGRRSVICEHIRRFGPRYNLIIWLRDCYPRSIETEYGYLGDRWNHSGDVRTNGKNKLDQYLQENDGALVVVQDVRKSNLSWVNHSFAFKNGRTIVTTAASAPHGKSLCKTQLEPSDAKNVLLHESERTVSDGNDRQCLSVLCGDDDDEDNIHEPLKNIYLRCRLEIKIAGAILRKSPSLKQFSSKLIEKIDLLRDDNDIDDSSRLLVMQALFLMVCENSPIEMRVICYCAAFPMSGPMPKCLLHKILQFPRPEYWANPDLPPQHGHHVTELHAEDLISCALETGLLEEDRSASKVILDTVCKFDRVECDEQLVMNPLIISAIWPMIPPSFLAGMAFNYTSGLLDYLGSDRNHDCAVIAALYARAVMFCRLLCDKAPLHLFGEDTLTAIKKLLVILEQQYNCQIPEEQELRALRDKLERSSQYREQLVKVRKAIGKCPYGITVADNLDDSVAADVLPNEPIIIVSNKWDTCTYPADSTLNGVDDLLLMSDFTRNLKPGDNQEDGTILAVSIMYDILLALKWVHRCTDLQYVGVLIREDRILISKAHSRALLIVEDITSNSQVSANSGNKEYYPLLPKKVKDFVMEANQFKQVPKERQPVSSLKMPQPETGSWYQPPKPEPDSQLLPSSTTISTNSFAIFGKEEISTYPEQKMSSEGLVHEFNGKETQVELSSSYLNNLTTEMHPTCIQQSTGHLVLDATGTKTPEETNVKVFGKLFFNLLQHTYSSKLQQSSSRVNFNLSEL